MKVRLKCLLLLILIIPTILYAQTYEYDKSLQEANGYINRTNFASRNKYLLLNINNRFVMNYDGTMKFDDDFINGGLLNQREFCISTGRDDCKGKSYLIIPSSYWTCSGNATNRYYVDIVNGISTKSDNIPSSVRVTEFVKPDTRVSGLGTFSNPWIFTGSHYVLISTNSKSFATFVETGTNKIEKYSNTSCISGNPFCVNFDISVHHGYENNKNDGCNLHLISKGNVAGDSKRNHKYEISEITNDIECVAIFAKKVFTITFNCNIGSGTIASKTVKYDDNLVLPTQTCTRTGYLQDGWKNGNNEKWNSGSTIKFHYDDDQIGIRDKKLDLNAIWKANTYYVQYNGNGNTGGSTATSTHTYDTSKNLTTNGFVRKGYSFSGWATTAGGAVKYNNGASVLNLTSTPNGTVTLYAVWKICPVGTYNTGTLNACTSCPSGYTSAQGASAENQCYMSVPAGKYLTAKAASSTNCPAGQYRSGTVTVNYGNSVGCSNCAANTYSTGGAGSCTSCPSGYIVASGAGTAQNKCYMKVPGGKYLTAKASSATNCAAGQYRGGEVTKYYGESVSCSNCAVNTYSTGGASSCTACPSGYQVASGAGTAQNKCYMKVPGGKYLVAKAASSTNCAAGTYRNGEVTKYYGESVSCSGCPSDQWSNEGATGCFSKCNSVNYTVTSTCSVSCGGGTKKREAYSTYDSSYRCSAKDDWNGGSCNTQGCCSSTYVSYGGWGGWGSCSTSCGGGTQYRYRTNTYISNYNGQNCGTFQESGSQSCNTQGCCSSVWTSYGGWSGWGGCSASCGGGTQSRSRTNTNYSNYNGQNCGSWSQSESQSCNTHSCIQCYVYCTGPNNCSTRKPDCDYCEPMYGVFACDGSRTGAILECWHYYHWSGYASPSHRKCNGGWQNVEPTFLCKQNGGWWQDPEYCKSGEPYTGLYGPNLGGSGYACSC